VSSSAPASVRRAELGGKSLALRLEFQVSLCLLAVTLLVAGNLRLRGGGDGDIGQEIQKAGDNILKLLDKSAPKSSMDSYYDTGDRVLQDMAGKVQDSASRTWNFFGEVVCPKAEDAALRAYYLAQHPAEAQAALQAQGASALAAARALKNSIPGASRVQRDIRNR
jgi:hypothetical protein